MSLLLWLACASAPSDAELYRRAQDPTLPTDEALRACEALREGASECMAGVLRERPVEDGAACARIPEDRWREECHFGLAERLGKAGDRWAALDHCGRAGRFHDECLYHLWSFELQAAADPGQRGGERTRATDLIAQGREVVAFWSGIRSVAQDPEQLLWDDWWHFAHLRNKPAELAACDALPEADRAHCRRGTITFVRRHVTEAVIRPDFDPRALDRACRALGEGDERPVHERLPANLLAGLYLPDPALDAAALEGLQGACQPDVARPWNPVFRPVEGGRVAPGAPPPDGPPPGAPPPDGPPPGPRFDPALGANGPDPSIRPPVRPPVQEPVRTPGRP